MNPILVKALQLILSLSILIVLHELGHFIPAKLFKTRVEKFFLFFDVKFALFKKKIGETVYGIGWLPLGGYVKISGMIDESMDTEQMAEEPKPWEFRSKPAWQRLIIMIGGVTINLILGFLIYMMILFVWGSEKLTPEQMPEGFAVDKIMEPYGFRDGDQILSVNGEKLDNALNINRYLLVRDVSNIQVQHADGSQEMLSLPDTIGNHIFKQGVMAPFYPLRKPVADTILPDSPAKKYGLLKGDEILAVNGNTITYFEDIKDYLKANTKATLTIKRNNQVQDLNVVPGADGKLQFSSKTFFNLSPENREYTLSEAISKGFSYGYWTLHDYVAQFKYMFTKKGASQVGGFASIGNMFPPVWDWQAFWSTTAFISIALAFMNILPIPALDGGHVLFLLYEIITGRKPNDKFLEKAQIVGFFILIGLLLYANGNDIYRLIFKG